MEQQIYEDHCEDNDAYLVRLGKENYFKFIQAILHLHTIDTLSSTLSHLREYWTVLAQIVLYVTLFMHFSHISRNYANFGLSAERGQLKFKLIHIVITIGSTLIFNISNNPA